MESFVEGIDPNDKEHAGYLKDITEDLVTHLCNMIDTAITEREKQESKDSLLEECKQHIVFCQNKCNGFQGREDVLQVWIIYDLKQVLKTA